ncbi:MAG: dimethyl sulfoxide reductase anchor subunit [gamma proteobacterium symbiont of Bathyaustriella thionipta]|nr:dimethyl sulfoxide reductase anchor subunit [gamma proteobacterium symbiont of Bathyaustriella thionipta]
MHPAFSVIFLTTLIGAGQGLFLALFTSQFYSLANLLHSPQTAELYAPGSLLALLLLGAGLLASFFHLGHPERAWRSATQWRTSWLSREVIVLPAFMSMVMLYGIVHYFGWTQTLFVISDALPVDLSLIIGTLGTLLAFALFICTAMIYASIKFLQEWHTPLTLINYTLFGIASGFMLAAALSAWMNIELVAFFGAWAVIATLLALLTRVISLIRNQRIRHKSSIQTALGIRHNHIKQSTMGFMGGSFNTREFFHGRSDSALKIIKYFFILMVFVVPVALILVSYMIQSPHLPMLAFAIQFLGLIAERYYFFADARHPQNLYYQNIA